MNLLQIFLQLFMIKRFLHKSIESFFMEITKLVFRYCSMSNYHITSLLSFLDISISKLPDLIGCHHTIHTRHVYIHYDQFVRFLVSLHTLLAFHKGFLSRYCLVWVNFVFLFEDHLQNLNVENCVIYDQDGREVFMIQTVGDGTFFFWITPRAGGAAGYITVISYLSLGWMSYFLLIGHITKIVWWWFLSLLHVWLWFNSVILMFYHRLLPFNLHLRVFRTTVRTLTI